MDRMKTFFTYFLMLLVFFVISNMLEDGLIKDMYHKIKGEIINTANINGTDIELDIRENEGRATNVNGFLHLTVSNYMQTNVEKCYMKVELINEQDLVALTEYVELSNFTPEFSQDFKLKFSANNIEKYRVSLIDQSQKPDTSKIIRILGFDIDLGKYGIDPTNVFGIDLTNFSLDTIKDGGRKVLNFAIDFAKSLPTWAYVVASGIVLWNLPAGFLFFL